MGLREKNVFIGEKYHKKRRENFIDPLSSPGGGGEGWGKIIKPQGFYCSAVSRAYTIIVMFVSTLLQLFTPHYLGT